MKNALILHGTGDSSKANWFGWLGKQLEKKDWKVWIPDLPRAEKPNIQKYNKHILANKKWEFGEDSVIIGHSSGAVATLGLLQVLPDGVRVDTCYLVGVFRDDLGWEALDELFNESFDYEKIRASAKRFVFVHSDNDPYCPLEHAEYLSEKLGGELIVMSGEKHFSISTVGDKYEQFPELLEMIG
jgi:uncharacterized protein